MPLGLFVGQRTFSLTPQAGGAVKVHMREEFTRLMAPLITRSIPDLTDVRRVRAVPEEGR
jgi:hypothetical protein